MHPIVKIVQFEMEERDYFCGLSNLINDLYNMHICILIKNCRIVKPTIHKRVVCLGWVELEELLSWIFFKYFLVKSAINVINANSLINISHGYVLIILILKIPLIKF